MRFTAIIALFAVATTTEAVNVEAEAQVEAQWGTPVGCDVWAKNKDHFQAVPKWNGRVNKNAFVQEIYRSLSEHAMFPLIAIKCCRECTDRRAAARATWRRA